MKPHFEKFDTRPAKKLLGELLSAHVDVLNRRTMKITKKDMSILQFIANEIKASNNADLLKYVTHLYDTMGKISRDGVYGTSKQKLLDYERPDLENMKTG